MVFLGFVHLEPRRTHVGRCTSTRRGLKGRGVLTGAPRPTSSSHLNLNLNRVTCVTQKDHTMTHTPMTKVRHLRFDDAAEAAISIIEQHLAGSGLRPSAAGAI